MTSTIAHKDVCQGAYSIVPWAINCQMSYSSRSFVLEISHEVQKGVAWLQEGPCDVLDPVRHCCGEHKSLHIVGVVLFDFTHNLLDILLKTKVEHLISLVKHNHLQAAEVKIFALHMIDNSTARTHKNVNASPQMISLLVERGSSVHRKDLEFSFTVFQRLEFFGDLEGELAGRSQNHGQWLALSEKFLLAETFDHGKTEAERFS